MRFRRAATGARLLEIGGEDSAAKADSLAKKLREVLSPEAVRVVRPVKRAEIRVTGLDDSADAIEVADAVAKEGGCAVEDLKYGRIVVGPRGDGSLWLSCPVAAARRLSDSGRLLVGWTSARVSSSTPDRHGVTAVWSPGTSESSARARLTAASSASAAANPTTRRGTAWPSPTAPSVRRQASRRLTPVGGSGCIFCCKKPAVKGPKTVAPKRKAKKRKAKRAGAEQMDTVP
ncbi:uncharacterized protein LOC126374656 [Pectinophora gossypiella]|uniref:uncharacterized protein LOC126374656 n=1 Tax=Pectinophora gossypiella TaxID=13191 RepID=UPI00214EBEFE|nr:uncharacterized protein LOC126374656 [Pectinophora gossypiella]